MLTMVKNWKKDLNAHSCIIMQVVEIFLCNQFVKVREIVIAILTIIMVVHTKYWVMHSRYIVGHYLSLNAFMLALSA